MDDREPDESDSKPAAKKARRSEVEAETGAVEDHESHSSGVAVSNHVLAGDGFATLHRGSLGLEPVVPAQALLGAEDAKEGDLEAMVRLHREIVTSRYIQQQPYLTPMIHQPPIQFADPSSLFNVGGLQMPLFMTSPQGGMNFAMPCASNQMLFSPQVAAYGPPSAVATLPLGGLNSNLLSISIPNQQYHIPDLTTSSGRSGVPSTDLAAMQGELHGSFSIPSQVSGRGRPTQEDPQGEDSPPKAFPMALDTDEDSISKYQCILRKQIEFFEASTVDLRARAQGRNVPIRLKQIGIRCIHCAGIPPGYRPRGAVYFPVKLASLYQSAQNMANNHFNANSCKNIPEAVIVELNEQKRSKSSNSGGGQRYWVQTAYQLGIVDSEATGLEYRDPRYHHGRSR